MILGSHMSIAGGLDKAIERGESVGCDTIQIFTKNNNQWKAKPLTKENADAFKARWKESTIGTIFSHDAYLINLAGPDKEVFQKSMAAFQDEMERAEKLGLSYLVMHPGAHKGTGEEKGIQKVADSFNKLHKKLPGQKLVVLLETTAGQGTNLGYTFEHLAKIRSLLDEPERVGICLDTCHIFAAGYDVRTPKEYKKTMKKFDEIIGLENLKAIHLNDSKKELGSRVDRHEHIGKGFLELESFKSFMNDKKLKKIPMVLETPKSADYHEDVENLKVLKGLIKK